MSEKLIACLKDLEVPVSVANSKVSGSAKTLEVEIDGRRHQVDAVQVGPNTWSVLLNGKSQLVDTRGQGESRSYQVEEFALGVQIESAQRLAMAKAMASAGASRPKGEVIKAPIAGRVVAILVELGQEISAGTTVAILEAMKMENEIKCSRDGVVSEIGFEPGQSVETSAKLLVLKAPAKDES